MAKSKKSNGCDIQEVGKRRDGGHRYWCLAHRADATAKYGVPAERCVAAFDEVVGPDQTFDLDPSDYPGGIALWGAVPAVYGTTTMPVDRGIHVHARKKAGTDKEIDQTVRKLRVPVKSSLLSDGWTVVDELDAINYMVSRVFKHQVKLVECTKCGFSHLDRDWFAVHKHKRHLCHGCGRQFSDVAEGIGNPVAGLDELLGGTKKHRLVEATQPLSIRQAEYPGGIQIWASNPAFVWTSESDERAGIHVHAYRADGVKAMPDGTFKDVTIDGIKLNSDQVRMFMAQCAMPHIRDRVVYLKCPKCGRAHFDKGELAHTPHVNHECHRCKTIFTAPTRFKLTIGNPFVETRRLLSLHAVNPVQPHFLDLRPETI